MMAGNAERRPAAPAVVSATERRSRSAPLRWFSPLPVALLKDPSIAAEAKVLAGLLLHYDGPKGCYPRIESLMRDLGVSKHTVIRLLEELERYGFLTREKRGRNNYYHLTPAYVPPARPDDIALTGELRIENARPPKPVKRTTLHKRRPEPVLPPIAEKVAPVQLIPIGHREREPKKVPSVQPISGGDVEQIGSMDATLSAVRQAGLVAPVRPIKVARVQQLAANRLHGCDPDITNNQRSTKNQQQQETAAVSSKTDKPTAELALINEGVSPEDAVRWAFDLVGLSPDDIRAALKIMRAKPAYRRREIDRPGAYMRTLCKTQVHLDRELAEHNTWRTRPAELQHAEQSDGVPQSIQADTPRAISASPHLDAIPSQRDDETPQSPSNAEQIAGLEPDAATRVDAHARRLCPKGPKSPIWAAAVAIALRAEASHSSVLQFSPRERT